MKKEKLDLKLMGEGIIHFDDERLTLIGGNVYHTADSDYLNITQNCAVAGVVPFKCLDGLTRYVIVTDKYFEQLPQYVQEFFLLHELGHIANGHLDKDEEIRRKEKMNRQFGKTNNNEFEADSFAAKNIGKCKAINALNYLLKHTDFKYTLIMRRELNARIANLIGGE